MHVFIFEGGEPGGPVSADLARVRERLALDRVPQLLAAGAEDVCIVSDREELLEAAARAGAGARRTAPPFRLGAELAAVARDMAQRDPDAWLLSVGGGAGALLGADGWRRLLGRLDGGRRIWLNNPQSPDIIAFRPASLPEAAFAPGTPWPDSDNALGYFLSDFGLERELWPNEAALNFDIDTPAEVGVLAWMARREEAPLSDEFRRLLGSVPWADTLAGRFETVAEVVAGGGELLLVGRVGPTVVARLNERWKCRVRLLSEERGMKALGRVAAGRVRSLAGHHIDAVGAEAFCRAMLDVADAVLFDSRVVLAHWRSEEPEEGRFCADLGLDDRVRDPRLASLARAARGGPIVLGGHTLVYGGLWMLSEVLYYGSEWGKVPSPRQDS